jgi:hypothetical protein
MSYKGKFKPKNVAKYRGDPTKIVYRSLWERQVFRYMDTNQDVVWWSSEETVIPYICATDNKPHRYFIDLTFQNSKGQRFLVEIKPAKETVPPKTPKRKTKRYLNEVLTYAKNTSKWEYASEYADNNGYTFQIWTENSLAKLGIKILKK